MRKRDFGYCAPGELWETFDVPIANVCTSVVEFFETLVIPGKGVCVGAFHYGAGSQACLGPGNLDEAYASHWLRWYKCSATCVAGPE